jgi:hypothetical protein
MSQVTILAQVLSLIPREPFKKLVLKHQSDKHSKGISSWDHLVSMLFCHLAGAQSLRDISNGLLSTLGNRSHMGLSHVPRKSSLSYINANRDWQLFRDLYFELYDHLQTQGLPRRNALRNIRRKVLMIDASVVPLCLSLFDWAQYRSKKGGVKLHMVLDYDGLLPVFCHLTNARTHEVTVARTQQYPRGSVLVFDRGYTDFSWWRDLDSSGVFFISRAKENLDWHIVQTRKIPFKEQGDILFDYEIQVGSRAAKPLFNKPLRLIRFHDKELGRTFEFITNQMSWTASDIALAYKERWNIEVFFKFLKQHLRIKSFVGTSKNAVMIQIWTAMIAFLLLKYLQAKATFKWNMSNLSNFLKMASFAKINLFEWLNNPVEVIKPPPKGQTQLQL